MNNAAIGVFDSGVGGLTCVKELIKLLPNEISFILVTRQECHTAQKQRDYNELCQTGYRVS